MSGPKGLRSGRQTSRQNSPRHPARRQQMPNESTQAIALDGVSHRYGHTTALDNVSLTIPNGTATAIVGPDGVGKSTLLALISGVKRGQSGTIQVLGGDMASAAHRDRASPRIAYMPQGLGRNLYPTLSVVEKIDFFGSLFGLGSAERRGGGHPPLCGPPPPPFPP